MYPDGHVQRFQQMHDFLSLTQAVAQKNGSEAFFQRIKGKPSDHFCQFMVGFPSVNREAESGLRYQNVCMFRSIKSVGRGRSEEHTSELQSRGHLVCRLLL